MAVNGEAKALREAIGEEICHLRLSANMTQADLGEAINVAQHQIQRYEAGEGTLSVDRLAAIAAALKVHPGRFFGRKPRLGDLSFGTVVLSDPMFRAPNDENIELAMKIGCIRNNEERRDIILSIEQTVELLVRNQDS